MGMGGRNEVPVTHFRRWLMVFRFLEGEVDFLQFLTRPGDQRQGLPIPPDPGISVPPAFQSHSLDDQVQVDLQGLKMVAKLSRHSPEGDHRVRFPPAVHDGGLRLYPGPVENQVNPDLCVFLLEKKEPEAKKEIQPAPEQAEFDSTLPQMRGFKRPNH